MTTMMCRMIMMRDKGTKVYRANITHHVSGVARGRHFTRALPSREVANARDEEADVRPQRVGEADELLLRVEDLAGQEPRFRPEHEERAHKANEPRCTSTVWVKGL